MTQWLTRHFVKDYNNAEDPAVRTSYGKMAGWVGIFCNLLLFGGKIAVGLLSGSIAITADAVNNLSDASSSIVTLLGFKLAAKPADNEHPFGHARIEYIAGLAVAVMVLVIGIELGKSSLDKIINPTPVSFTVWSYGVLVFSILLKAWMAVFNRSIGKKIDSTTLEATFADSRNDVIATGVVLVAAVFAGVTGINIDGWMGLAVAAFILYSGIGLVKDTLNPLLGEAPSPELVKYVDDKISGYPGVLGTHDLIVHDYGPGRQFASAHVEMSSKQDVLVAHDIIDNIEQDFLDEDNIHLIIHYDPIVTGDAQMDDARNWVIKKITEIDPSLTMHDLRLVDGPTHTNYVFDVVVPADFAIDDEELKEKIQQKMQRGKKPIYTVVTIDKSYAAIPK
ncbi:cation diffusion facilitator family transporter [Ruminococcaceae bacterium OttesenSCG-928-A16]|nr:cation diffusion facilitator family transporter [Ruminococcaceae bacterium OttesenSCG-928-A16]